MSKFKKSLNVALISSLLTLIIGCQVTINPSTSTNSTTGNTTITTNSTEENGLVAYYKLDGDAKDSSKNKNDGVATSLLSYTDGKFNKSAKFDGIEEQYIKIEDSESFSSFKNTITLSAWVNPADETITGTLPIITKGKEKEDFTLWINEVGTNMLLNWSTEKEFWAQLNTEDHGFEKLKKGQWYLITATYGNWKVKYYLNDSLMYEFDYNSDIDDSNEAIYIGVSYPGIIDSFKGLIDEVKVYNRALSLDEIKNIYNKK